MNEFIEIFPFSFPLHSANTKHTKNETETSSVGISVSNKKMIKSELFEK